MPRPKSEITDGAQLVARVTKEQHEVFKKLGGSVWLRAYLNDIVQRRKEDAEANSAAARGMVAVYPARPAPIPKSTKANRPFG